MKTNRCIAVSAVALAALSLASCGSQGDAGRDQIRAVGSSTVLPFAKAVAEEFAKSNAGMKAPIVEGNGTGGGMKLFCGGVGAQFPDIENASRRMKKSEFDDCQANGVKDITEIQVGLDGIAFASDKAGPDFKLTPLIIYKALAKNPFGKPQTAKNWNDVDPSLPAEPIMVYGPATVSGTRDALKELLLHKGCETDAATKALKDSDKKKFDAVCGDIRDDGAYADTSDNYNLIVQKLQANPKAVGIFGFSYLDENKDKLKGMTINGVTPSYETISSFTYPGARPLFIYVKKAHVSAIKGLKEYVAQWSQMWGKGGPLTKLGMIAAPDDVLAKSAKAVSEMPSLDGSELK
jgi:phosphate transport system substrate-binding protein